MRIGWKLALVGLLLLLLLVPLGLLDGLVSERQQRGQEVAQEIARATAGQQALVGPLLLVEAEHRIERRRVVNRGGQMSEETEESVEPLHYLVGPESLDIEATLGTETRGRSLFSVPVFLASQEVTGRFRHRPPPVDAGELRPRRAWLVLGLGDNRGVRRIAVTLNGKAAPVEPGSRVAWLAEGLHVPVPLSALDGELPFALTLELAGTGGLSWAPVGGENTVRLAGDWPHPGFEGRHLPDQREVGEAGFSARWAVSRLSSQVSQALAGCGPADAACPGVYEGAFGLRLVEPVDRYLMTERAIKYALLFLGLVFGAVFLVEALAERPVHFVQYGLTGLAMAMFYLLLLSLSEHIGFGPAYAAATLACSGLLGYYLAGVLGGRGRGLGFGLGLAGLYGLLYLLLRSEDHALLVGSGVLFAALATVMALTRRVDWHSLGKG
ncbi:MAG TPA: cell envelope integrity protein CreD [Arenimonas sp.]|nr:cell envelope integrity protein CreD [Arenimonas sp.]